MPSGTHFKKALLLTWLPFKKLKTPSAIPPHLSNWMNFQIKLFHVQSARNCNRLHHSTLEYIPLPFHRAGKRVIWNIQLASIIRHPSVPLQKRTWCAGKDGT